MTIGSIADRREQKQQKEDAAKYRALQLPEKIDQLVLELAMMGVRVPARDTAFFQAAVQKWLAT